MKKQLVISLLTLFFLFLATTLTILYGRGYRFGLEKGKPDLSGTGLLVTTSNPDGAQVFINDHLTTATNNTINLSPGDYAIRIYKEGYFPWEKKIKVQKEVVAKAEALLLPTTPNLEDITAGGVENPVIDPSKTKIAYTVKSQTSRKNGIYVLDMSIRPVLTLQSSSTQIVDDAIDTFSTATLIWSPDGKELLATISSPLKNPTTYLLNSSGFNDNPKDVTETLNLLNATWQKEKEEKQNSQLSFLKPALKKMILENFNIIEWPLDETKILYEASTSANLPLVIAPRLIGVDSTPEERSITKGSLYVYDIKEDKNFKLPVEFPKQETENSQEKLPLSWFPDSKHLIFVKNKKINVMEYDGTNSTTIYAGPFVDNYVFPWPNGSKMIILTNLNNPDIPSNLYAIGLK